jgi:hypothetical protein
VQMNGWAHNPLPATELYYLHIEIFGPGLTKSCGQFNLAGGANSPNCSWAPNSNENAGTYCATVWQWLGGKNYANLGSSCVGVH